ncbi:MAG TPA: NAD-dependent epimerase/dehydratase family protein [Actinomycetota bacterium]|nr:NAD-dependent epimerase/dehydratase family protein [Actinomycetota bacterium]
MTTIAITGVGGGLGRCLLARLDADPTVERVVGIDAVPPRDGSPKMEFFESDVRDERIGRFLDGCDAVVHLAFAPDSARRPDEMRSVNVDGTRNVAAAARAVAGGRLVFASTATVYGANPDNDFPLTERSPVRPSADYAYAVNALDAEEAAAEAGDAVVLRLANVFGSDTDNFVMRMFQSPRFLTIRGHAPPLQMVHQDDAAAALHLACGRALSAGIYNVAADGWMDLSEALALAGRRSVEMPEAVAYSLAERAWRLNLSGAPPAEIAYLMYPWVMDNAKMRAAGWTPARTNRETLVEAVEAHRPWVALGRGKVRKADLAKGAAATVGLLAAMGALRRSRRRP